MVLLLELLCHVGSSDPRKSTSSPLKYPFNFCSCPPPQVSAPQCLLCPQKNFSHVECHASTNHNIYDFILRLDCSMKDALCILLSNPPQQCPRRMRAALGIQIIDRRERKRGVVSALETTRGNRKTKQNTRETQTAPQRVRSVRRRRREESQQETSLPAELQRDGARVLPGLEQAKECGSDHAHVKPPHSVCPTNTIMLRTT